MKFCVKCGSEVSNNMKFCKKCGYSLGNMASDKEDIQPLGKQDNMSYINEEKNFNSSIEYNKANYGNNKNNIKQTEQVKNSKSIFSTMSGKIIIGVVLLAAIAIGIFFNRIEGFYYAKKCSNSVIDMEKVEYAAKAVKAFDSNNNKELLKNTLVHIAENDVNLAENKLQEVSSFLTQGDFKNIASNIKQKKVDKLCNESKYTDALNELNEISKLGGDFKANKNYDKILLNIAATLTGNPVRGNKDILMEKDGMYYDNLDDDEFDEIIELKNKEIYYSSEMKMNLYKFKDSNYKLVNSKAIDYAYNGQIQGVYNYAENKKGIFVNYEVIASDYATSVFAADNGTVAVKGTVFGNASTKGDDADNDGIYEILSKSRSRILSSSEDTLKWYKIYEDGRTPTEVVTDKSSKEESISNDNGSSSSDLIKLYINSDYILGNSNSSYLTDSDLKSLSKDQLALARNEIFARHGYVFKEEPFKTYFPSKSWYSANPNYDGGDSDLNAYEKANYQAIQEWEKK